MGLTGYTDQVLGASMKYDVMHPLKPIFLTIVGKILNVIQAFSPWGIQTDPFAPY